MSAKTFPCKHCGHPIVQIDSPSGRYWTSPIGEPPAPGASLPNECPGQPLHATTFGRHEPAL